MRYILLFYCFFIINSSFAQTSYTGQSIEDILDLPENEINVGIAALVLAKDFYPDINIPFFLQTFDYLADRFNYYFGNYTDPEDRIGAINTFLYRPGYWNDEITFSYDDDDLHVQELKNKFINGYISSKKGSCITMPMLYVILAERLHFPVKPVRSAKHFFIRYEPEEFTVGFNGNIEATNGGGFISNVQYKEDALIPDKAIENGVYLRTLSKKEYIASLLLVNANEHLKNRDIEKAKYYYKLAIKYDSTFSPAYMNYGLTVFYEARNLENKMNEEIQKAIKQIPETHYTVQTPKEETKLPENNSKASAATGLLEGMGGVLELGKIPSVSQPDKQTATVQHRQAMNNLEMQMEIKETTEDIEERYKPAILAKIEEYRKYTGKAKELGIVSEYPLEFFQKQAESIKHYKEKGGY